MTIQLHLTPEILKEAHYQRYNHVSTGSTTVVSAFFGQGLVKRGGCGEILSQVAPVETLSKGRASGFWSGGGDVPACPH